MNIYIISIIALFAAWLITRLVKRNKNLFFCVLATSILTLLIGLRNYQYVGVDLFRYQKTYDFLKQSSFIDAVFFKKSGSSAFYYTFCWVANKFSIDYQLFVSCVGAFCVIIAGKYIYQHSKEPLLSFLFYIGMGAYTFSFSGLRQALAMSFVLLSVGALFQGKKCQIWIWAIIAFLFHPTAILYIVFLFVITIPMNKTVIIIYGITAVIIYLFRIQLARLVTQFYDFDYVDVYASSGDSGGTFVFLCLLLIAFLILYIEKTQNRNKWLNIFLCVLMFAIAIQMLSAYSYTFTRINLYFMLILSAEIPILINYKQCKKRIGKLAGCFILVEYVAIASICIALFFVHIKGELLSNYRFLWEM